MRDTNSVLAALTVMVFGWVIAAGNTGLAYATVGNDVIPIIIGTALCLVFVIALRVLHRAWWLAALSVLPGLLILVGSVQHAPEAVLADRGIRESVVITADSAGSTASTHHRYTLLGKGGKLAETLEYRGSGSSYRVGDRIEVIRDPDGVVPLEDAANVDPRGRLKGLVIGVVGWTVITVLAGWRGHVRRRKGIVYDD
ncbi:hypothetical protein NLX83_36230 [Allokutzneria sp. A3M-2-11 16]|uniref:hypothetical protein n=1 Tax=Allokutzneria sp. A3M-2-11 16 TaxID=2962043 RepID=UPI0020B804E4|nr:hypothetical protein [Allokutzneria sp. A3M-2-11 16]MCP3804728.1 hypothetical protein [Allokutzneria sp. A3M-2-11 16]